MMQLGDVVEVGVGGIVGGAAVAAASVYLHLQTRAK